jgi:hypothetical protein
MHLPAFRILRFCLALFWLSWLRSPDARCHESRNACTLRILAAKLWIMAGQSQLPRRESNKQRKKTCVRSERWRRPAEFLESAPRDELKKFCSLIEGHVPDAILKVE